MHRRESVAAGAGALASGTIGERVTSGANAGRRKFYARIEALRALATQMNARLFINARTDTYCVAHDDRVAGYQDTARRAQLYAAAGADGIFVPGMDVEDVFPFARLAVLPLNVYAGGGWAPPVHLLRRAGVRRISLGCGPLQSVFGSLRRIASEAFAYGTYTTMSSNMLPVSDVNELFLTPEPSHQKG